MSTVLDFKIGPIKSIKLDPRPHHAMGPVVNVEIAHILGTSHGLATPAQCEQLGLALIQAGQEASGSPQCCASPRHDCMGMLVPGVGDRCQALSGGVRCHNADACKAGQSACQTPHACGVKP